MRGRSRDPEARIIYLLCVVIAAPYVAATIVRRGAVGAGTTICMLIAAAGVVGLVVDWRTRTRIPRARVITSRSGAGGELRGRSRHSSSGVSPQQDQ